MFAAKGNLLAGMALCLAAFTALFCFQGAKASWRYWGVAPGDPTFMDMSVVTAGAQSAREGLDPMYSNPHDVIGRPVNYPRIWQLLYRIGVDEHDTKLLGVLSIALFLATFFLAMPPTTNRRVAGLLLALFSPAVMLACERGNTDLLIFVLLALAVAVERTGWSFLLVMFGFVLKLYPLAALGVVVRHGRKQGVAFLLAGAAFAGLYLAYNLDDLVQIVATTPKDSWISFGRDVISLKLLATRLPGTTLARIGSMVLIAGWLTYTVRRWWFRPEGSSVQTGARMAGFRIGAGCYVGTFLIGTNFDYKLVFMLLALPQLQDWAGGSDGAVRGWARLALGGLYYSVWRILLDKGLAAAGAGDWPVFLCSETAHWIMFAALSLLLIGTLPVWVRTAMNDFAPAAAARGPAAEAAKS